MLRQWPGRNQRSKGFKAKHGVQIFLLLAVCFWLLYQLKHKEMEFGEHPVQVLNDDEIVRLGRKDLLPRVEEMTSANEIHAEHEDKDDQGEEEGKHEDKEDEGRHEEEEEEKIEDGGEEEVDKGDEEEKDRDGDMNTQEAREQNYKGDDASSAVLKDTPAFTTQLHTQPLNNTQNITLAEETQTIPLMKQGSNTSSIGVEQSNSNSPLTGESAETTNENVDAADNLNSQEEEKAHIDLETLPEIQTQGTNSEEDAEAE